MDLAAVLSSRFMQTVARSQIDLCSSCRLCSDLVGIFTLKRNAPSLRAPRAETRLTVYRALRSFDGSFGHSLVLSQREILAIT